MSDAKPAHPAAEPDASDEAALIGKARQGDLGSYDELVRRYQQRIYATIYHMTANHEDTNSGSTGGR
jgi:hypothetical protein